MINGKWCFCTLALGEPYRNLAKQLAEDLARYAPGVTFFVLTDNASTLGSLPNVRIALHRKRSVLGYNDKLCVIHKALKQFDTVIFIDSDTRILAPINLSEDIFKPGLKAFLIRNWAYMLETYDTSPQGPEWQKNDLRMMAILKETFGLADNGRQVPCIVEFLFAITASKETGKFLRKWNELAELCEQNRFFVHEGYAMGLAAKLTGIPIEQHDFKGVRFFDAMISHRIHVQEGTMTEAEYEALQATISRYKNAPRKMYWGSRIDNDLRTAIRGTRAYIRYLRIRLFGLDLLGS